MCILVINQSNSQLLFTSRLLKAAVDHYSDMIFKANDQNTDFVTKSLLSPITGFQLFTNLFIISNLLNSMF